VGRAITMEDVGKENKRLVGKVIPLLRWIFWKWY